MAVSDKEYYQLTVSINKALNPVEAALKHKHARAAIINTFRTQGAQSLWAVLLRQPLQENRFTAWKFCHLLHKILREGHHLCVQHSLRHRTMMTELGKLWGHLSDGYGTCIQKYTKLLVTKLEFHERNPRFPGNLVLQKDELDQIAGNDINNHFQLAVEMFDYLDDILALQSTIFSSVIQVSSMTPAGQCRLAPLIPLIQDSNQLYDFLVRLMFKLHSNLPNDLLAGHRERFRSIFNQLKSFYTQAHGLQFFHNLIQVPKLPENAPNFSSSVDFGSYVAPVVYVPEPDPEPVVENLVDTSEPEERFEQRRDTPLQATIDFDQLLHERDELIRHLQTEIDRLNKCLKAMVMNHREKINHFEEEISKLHSQITGLKEELTNMRLKKEELELKVQVAPTLQQKAIEEEERAKASEEKFQKLKSMYTQIRDEHVKLLRQHGDVSKQLGTSKKEISSLITEKELIKAQLEEFREQEEKLSEELKKNSESVQNEKILSEKYKKLNENFENLKCKFDDLQADKSAQVAQLQIKVDEMEKIQAEFETLSVKHKEVVDVVDGAQKEKAELAEKLMFITAEKEKVAAEMVTIQQAKEAVEKDLERKVAERTQYEDEVKGVIVSKETEIQKLQEKIEVQEKMFKATNDILDRKISEKSVLESDFHDLLYQQAELEEKNRSSSEMIGALEASLQDARVNLENSLRLLLEGCIRSSEKLATRAMSENELTAAVGTSSYFMMIAEELQEELDELVTVYGKYKTENSNTEDVAAKTVLVGHLLATVHNQGMTVCNTSPDIESGEKTAQELRKFSQENVLSLFEQLHNSTPLLNVESTVKGVKERLKTITTMIHQLGQKSNNFGQLGDLLDDELSSMEKAIEEAANRIVEMLSDARASDSGIKLEVNEKILDACTRLMQSIRLLVQKSKTLQSEIVSLGKGTASVKEFYKRNHQWTEGLISAAKSVGLGANLLVLAADKAVAGESKNHLDLVVAAQEIAACTAQLVVASRVKAPRESKNLQALSSASRNVTQAAGAVVATAKDCSQQLEDVQDFDLTHLTVHQAKTLEMEIQVKVLGLEQALQVERQRLAAVRRKNYHNSDDKN